MDVVIMIFPSRLSPKFDRTKDIYTLSAAERRELGDWNRTYRRRKVSRHSVAIRRGARAAKMGKMAMEDCQR